MFFSWNDGIMFSGTLRNSKKDKKQMNLQDLVPPLELCRAIPKGEFKNTYFSYLWCSFCIGYEIVKTENVNSINSYPAPTLQEILEKLPWDFQFSHCYYFFALRLRIIPPTVALPRRT